MSRDATTGHNVVRDAGAAAAGGGASGGQGGWDERRKFTRYAELCPLVVQDTRKRQLTCSRTSNICDGGLYTIIDKRAGVELHQKLQLELKVARRTRNTFMFEPFVRRGQVVRLEGLGPAGEGLVGLAVKFAKPVELNLD